MSGLPRPIGLLRATAMVVGTIIGASIFVQPSVVSASVPSELGITLIWAAAGVLTLIGSLICAELASAFPRTGGVYVFLKETYGPALGFLWGWAMFWAMHSGIVAAIATVFARYVAVFVPLGTMGMRLVAIGVIAVISAINYLGVRQGSLVQTAFTVVKVLAVVAIIVIGFTIGKAAPDTVRDATSAGIAFRDIALAMIAGLFAFGGWHMVTYAAEETRDPERTIPRALVIGTLLVTACYIALNAVYFHVLPLATVVASTRVAADAADAVFGSGGAVTMAALVVFSTFGALSGIILAGPRVYQSMARDGLLFRWVGELHPRFQTPHRAILLQALWSAVLVSTGTYRTLFSLVVYTEWIFFGLMAGGLYILRRRADYAPPYRTWGYPLTPAIFIASTAIIVLNQVMSDPRQSALGLLLVAAGWPIHQLWLKRTISQRHAIGHAD